jgi:hypothetical protein
MNNEALKSLLQAIIFEKNDNETIVSEISDCKKYHIGDPVIVRCRDAGVHCGILVDYYDRTAILKNSRRMWKWWAEKEHSLSGVARHGIRRSDSKIAGKLDSELVLPEFCEIIPFSNQAAYLSIADCEAYNEQ